MQPSKPTWELFENLVSRILEAANFQIEVNPSRGDKGFDLFGIFGNEKWAVEVKYYRTVRAQPTLIEAAATRLAYNGTVAQAQKCMLVVSCVLPPELREMLEQKFNVTFVDRVDLRNWAATSSGLSEELDALIEVDQSDSHPAGTRREDPRQRSKPLGESLPTIPEDNRGTALCQELKTIKRGKEAWSEYERVCEKILKYLFPNDLHGWHSQKRTDDDLNRFDFICRVRPTTEFWKFVIDHLDSRYVLFEFKNYSGKIKQGQILTTEKYLLERGLRRVAIILTRAGAEPHAITMTQGAMREHGKLMLIVNDEKLCEMLHMKERGEDPTDCLFELADNFLLSLPR
ncbi:restriction endonuclease [Undibacterium sp. CY7W]|uniref:Restriction endonuclease n=1 Tax=Undibacterium rugosum TaxID=2762291 RepID=A0A923HZK9_9BURK|nr:restriction endonuclease [Undibacterium rugosum]MBC3933747.1 restriction endonuclease [Undibacterium rugosum]